MSGLQQRFGEFAAIRGRQRCILSHKLSLWVGKSDPVLQDAPVDGTYFLSLHVFSVEDLEYTTLSDVPILEGSFARNISDYRNTKPERMYSRQAFSGMHIGDNPLSPEEVPLGYIAHVEVCSIVEGRFCPGLHQNLILPQFEIRWESPDVRLYLKLLSFRWKILERLREERTMRPFEEQALSLAHPRFFVFSPHITRRANRAEL